MVQTLAEVAALVRRQAEQSEPSFSTRQIIERCFPDALVTGRRLPDGVLELVSRTAAGPVIVYERSLPGPTKRMVIAHAIAHVLFDDECVACKVGSAGVPVNEDRADEFAEELLVPLDELLPYVSRAPSLDDAFHEIYLDQVDEIASHFNVPSFVIDKRIRALIRLGRFST